jgi:hypothetical protein
MFRACRSDASFGWRADSDVQPGESEMHKALTYEGENLFGLALCLVQRQPYFLDYPNLRFDLGYSTRTFLRSATDRR